MLRGRTFAAALVACISVGFRQTNIVWLGFIMCSSLAREVNSRNSAGAASDTLEREQRLSTWSTVPAAIVYYLKGAWRWRGSMLRIGTPFLLVLALFVAFLYLNGGVVIGDRSAHAPVFHPPLLYYFSLFCVGFGAPLQLISRGTSALATVARAQPLRFLVGGTAVFLLLAYTVHAHTHAHKYLLADNRHYTFYVWKLLFRRGGQLGAMLPYMLCPAYALAGWCLFVDLGGKAQPHPLWLQLYITCCAMVLVPGAT